MYCIYLRPTYNRYITMIRKKNHNGYYHRNLDLADEKMLMIAKIWV